MHSVKKVAVVGAGTMGVGVTLDLVTNGYEVILKDLNVQKLKHAETLIKREFRGLKMLKPGLVIRETQDLLAKITFTTSYDLFDGIDIIIENVTERWDVKKKVYEELAGIFNSNAIYLVNTSCTLISSIAALLPDPTRVIGAHFMNPVPLRKTIEIIRGEYTSPETISQTREFLSAISKSGILVEDSPGFVTNRLSHLFMNEAAFLVMEKVASAKDIDMLFKEGYGHQTGPLETADLIGIDTVVDSLQVLYEQFQDPKFRCCPLLKRMVSAGNLGRKSGRGFFTY